jgi:TolB protein
MGGLTLRGSKETEEPGVNKRRFAPWGLAVYIAGLLIAGVNAGGAGNISVHAAESSSVGIFEGSGDVGTVLHKGSVVFDAAKGTYTIAGSGENMWFGEDAFQFAWKKMTEDVTLTADIAFVGKGVNEHRKAVLMVRQNLEGDSAYADVAVHGSGLTSLQFREGRGATTHEVQGNVNAPKRVRIEKRGDYFTMWVAGEDGKYALAGATGKVVLSGPYYVGIGVCSHDKDVVEKAVFSGVELKESTTANNGKEKLYSLMEIIDAGSLDRRAIYVSEGRFEAPNWMPSGKRLLFNRSGRIETIPVEGGATQILDTGFAVQCNNDHGISPDGTELVISDNSQEEHESRVYLLPIGGGRPRRVTKNAPSYWHGWSPDGKELAFVGQRDGEFDIYSIPVSGGEEARLTTAKGLDDGPEYTPDGKWIYFNSVRTGHMQIWKMRPDGSEQTQVTFDEYNNWFPHFAPDGSQMAFLTYELGVVGHPENQDVMLRIMSMKDGKVIVAAKLFGGQGTINVPSWSPDGKKFAFVSYALVPGE